jgi:hypothetical protein
MNETHKKLCTQFLLRIRREGYTLVENSPLNVGGRVNVDVYRGKTKIATFDDRQLGEWKLRVTAHDSTLPGIKQDFSKIHQMFIGLRDLYILYENTAPLQGYDQSLGYRSIMEYNGYTLAASARNIHGELEFGTFFTETRCSSYGSGKIICDNIYFDMDNYSAAKLNFVIRSGLLPKEQLITPENIKYFHGSCDKIMAKEGHLFDEDTKPRSIRSYKKEHHKPSRHKLILRKIWLWS